MNNNGVMPIYIDEAGKFAFPQKIELSPKKWGKIIVNSWYGWIENEDANSKDTPNALDDSDANSRLGNSWIALIPSPINADNKKETTILSEGLNLFFKKILTSKINKR